MSHDETLAILRNIPWNIPAFEVTVLSQLLTADTPIKPSKLTHLFPLNAQIDYPNAIVESLKDNTPPSTTVVSITREFRETQAKAVAATEDEIASLDAQILALRTRRAELIKKASPEWMKLNACDAVLSVIRRLPMEIVQEIALHARPLQPWPTRRDSPMSLSHVCKDWRNAALSMPQLWSEMYLEVDVNYNALQRILSVNEWFPRAKSCPLSLHLYINDDGAVNDHDMQHFVHALWPMLQNVHKLSIGAYWIFDYLPFFGGKLPNLEVLTLKCMAPDDQETELFMDDEPAALFRFLRFAEKLRHLVLDRPIPGAGLILAAFSWSTLTSLTMKQEMALTAWRNLIFICQALKTASFYLSEDDPVDQNGQIVSHSALEELSLAIVDGEMKLRLRLQTGPNHDVNAHASVQLKTLAALSLGGFPPVEITFLESVLQAASSVTRLRINLISLSALPFKLLTHLDASKPEILPYLQTLSISHGFFSMSPELLDVVVGDIKPMLHSRTSQLLPLSQQLREFAICLSLFDQDLTTTTRLFEVLEPCSKQGLKVHPHVGAGFTRDASIDNWRGGIEYRASRRAFAKAQGVGPPLREAPPIGRWSWSCELY